MGWADQHGRLKLPRLKVHTKKINIQNPYLNTIIMNNSNE